MLLSEGGNCDGFFVGVIVFVEKRIKKTNHKVAKQIRHESSVHLRSFSYRGCDKPCGGGQQSREKVCLGSDGLKYPSLLGLLVVVSGEFSFNCFLVC